MIDQTEYNLTFWWYTLSYRIIHYLTFEIELVKSNKAQLEIQVKLIADRTKCHRRFLVNLLWIKFTSCLSCLSNLNSILDSSESIWTL